MDKASQNIGRLQGITQQLRATQFYAARKHIVLPFDLIKYHKVNIRDLMVHPSNQGRDLVTNEEIENLVFDIASRAVGYVTLTRSQFKLHPKNPNAQEIKRLFCVNISPSEAWLKNLENEKFDIFSKNLNVRNDKLVYETYRRMFRSEQGY